MLFWFVSFLFFLIFFCSLLLQIRSLVSELEMHSGSFMSKIPDTIIAKVNMLAANEQCEMVCKKEKIISTSK